MSFTNTADPLFMFGAVAVGMFGMPELGATIALAHYLSSFLVGIIFRFHGRDRDNYTKESAVYRDNIIVRAFRALYNARQEDKRAIGQLLGDSVKASMNTIMLIGGFIIVFSVFIRIMTVVGITDILTGLFAALLSLIGYSTSLAPSLVSGLLEIDLGTLAASQADAPLIQKVAVASAIIAWSGLSVHGQVASIVIESGIRMTPYIIGRLLHAVLAAIMTVLLLGPGQFITKLLVIPVSMSVAQTNSWSLWLTRVEQAGYQIGILLGIMLIMSIAFHLARGIYGYVKR